MFLEAFFSTVASAVFTEIFKQVTDKNRRREEDIERIVDRVLRKHQPVGQTSVIEREVIMVLGDFGVLSSNRQLRLPSSDVSPEKVIEDWWDKRVYKIISAVSEKGLDVKDWRTDDGAPIQQWSYHGGTHQQWKLIPVGDRGQLFKIYSLHSAKVLDVKDWRTDNGAPIQQWTYRGQPNQKWRLLPIDSQGEIFKIISEHSKKALDVKDWSTDDGAPIQQWDYSGDTNQQWRLLRVN